MVKKLLFVIPHFYKRYNKSIYGSGKDDQRFREGIISKTISELYRTFEGNIVKIIICTNKEDHLVDSLPKRFQNKITHINFNLKNPMYLGFECHKVLLHNNFNYDYYCYLEDDILIKDKYFFDKLDYFNKLFPFNYLLQPNRYEKNKSFQEKFYLDGSFGAKWKSNGLILNNLRKRTHFFNPINPHSGCFFLNQFQFNKIILSKHFFIKTKNFVGPLESAATYSINKEFEIFKPSLLNPSFLEVLHQGDRYLFDYTKKPFLSIYYYINYIKKIIFSKRFYLILLKNFRTRIFQD